MKRSKSIIFILIVVLYGIYKLLTFELFDDNFTLIEEIKIHDKDYRLKIILFPSNATIQSSIQVRKVKNDFEEVLGIFERYNFLEDFEIKNDTIRTHIKVKKIGIKLPQGSLSPHPPTMPMKN